MSSVLRRIVPEDLQSTPSRSEALARRLEEGANALALFASSLTAAEWRARGGSDKRPAGVVVHHVASMYPLEINLAKKLAAREPIAGVTMDDVANINAKHALEHDLVSKERAIDLLKKNSAAAAAEIRALSDEELANAAAVSLYGGSPTLTCQFLLEDHAVRHSYHHLARLKALVGR